MDSLTFISHLIHDLAWPVAAVILAVLFKARIGGLLDRMIEVKVGKVSAKLGGAAEKLKKAREGLPPPRVELSDAHERLVKSAATSRHLPHVDRENRGPVELLATTGEARPAEPDATLDPSVQFESAWQRLNRKLRQKARAAGGGNARSANAAVAQLIEAGLPPQFERAFSEVKAVYEAAKRHNTKPIAVEPAREFARTCEALVEYLEQIEFAAPIRPPSSRPAQSTGPSDIGKSDGSSSL